MSDSPIVTYLKHSGFLLEYEGSKLLIDPYNDQSGDIDGDLVYCTHNHFDHVGGVETFLDRNPSALFVCSRQTAKNFEDYQGQIRVVDDGDVFTHGPWKLEITYLRHGFFSGVRNLAVNINAGDFSFYHCGDAVDFSKIPSDSIDVMAVPIVGGFTASPGKALKMISNLPEPRPTIIVMHWLFRNPSKFCVKLREKVPGIRCIVPDDGEQLVI